jgi:hypothetical protein
MLAQSLSFGASERSNVLSQAFRKLGLSALTLALFAGIPVAVYAGCLTCVTVTSCPDAGGKCNTTTECSFSPKACTEQ